METKQVSEWTQRYRPNKRETFQVRLSLEEKTALHLEAKTRNITANELIRLYARYLMEAANE